MHAGPVTVAGLKFKKGSLAAATATIAPQLANQLVLTLLPQNRVQLILVRRLLRPAVKGRHRHGNWYRNRNRYVVRPESAITLTRASLKFLQIAKVFEVFQEAFTPRWGRGRLGVR